MIPSQRRRRRISVALAVGGGLVDVASSDRKGTHAVVGAYRATRVGRCSLVALAGLIGAVTLVCGLGAVSTSVAAAAGDYAYGVSALANGSSIITGSFMGTATFGTTSLTSAGSTDTFTAKVNANGTYAWATRGGGTGNDSALGVSARANGSSIITGYFMGTATFGATTLTSSAGSTDTFTAKVNANGTYAWATKGGGTGTDSASGVSALANGSIIITGYFSGTATFGSTTLTSSGGSDDTFTAKLNANGTYAWATRGGGTDGDVARGVSARANGWSIITGVFSGTATFGSTALTSAGSYDTFTAKVNANGTYAWAIKGGGTSYDEAYGVSARANGSSIITGSFMGTATFGSTTLTSAGSADTFTAKVNANGTYAWATKVGGAGDAYAKGVSVRANGSSIITGSFDGTAIFGSTTLTSSVGSVDTFTAKLNANGTYAWATRGGGTGDAYASGVSALANGSSIITGYFTGNATFGSTTLTSAGSTDTFTAKVNANGSFAWATKGGGTGGAYASGAAVRANGSSIITGYFSGTATFGSTTLTSSDGSADTFTAKVNANGSFAWATRGGG